MAASLLAKSCQDPANEPFDLHEKLLTFNVWEKPLNQGVT